MKIGLKYDVWGRILRASIDAWPHPSPQLCEVCSNSTCLCEALCLHDNSDPLALSLDPPTHTQTKIVLHKNWLRAYFRQGSPNTQHQYTQEVATKTCFPLISNENWNFKIFQTKQSSKASAYWHFPRTLTKTKTVTGVLHKERPILKSAYGTMLNAKFIQKIS